MPSSALVVFVLAASTIVESRVIFPYAQVIQQGDMASYWDEERGFHTDAAFDCDNGCKVYIDVTSYGDIGIAQNNQIILNLTDPIYDNSEFQGYELPAGKNYEISIAQGDRPDALVFYVVSKNAPNYGTSVFAPEGITYSGQGRYFTLLSLSHAVDIFDFSGSFPAGYPKIYTNGYDALSDIYGVSKCKPVYQARSQKNAELSSLTIFAPIITVDFGVEGKHSVTANATDGKITPSAVSSTVYMSPGYVGCPFEGSVRGYQSKMNGVSESYTIFADSLDIAGDYNDVESNEIVGFMVNQDILSFYNITPSSFTKHYSQGAFKIALEWTRRSANSDWVLQLDFGRSAEAVPTTTQSGGAISLFIALIIVFIFA